MPTDIPLFPLGTVLFPGGLLPLRIFETRYVDMVRRCMRETEVFGVVRIESGSEISPLVDIAHVGSTARIVDFQTLDGGLLGLMCKGEQRFRIVSRSRQGDGLNRAEVEWLPQLPPQPVSREYAALTKVLREALSRLGELGRFVEPAYDDADWVGFRLAELLPLPVQVQQRLLEMDDPNERLAKLAPLIDTGSATE